MASNDWLRRSTRLMRNDAAFIFLSIGGPQTAIAPGRGHHRIPPPTSGGSKTSSDRKAALCLVPSGGAILHWRVIYNCQDPFQPPRDGKVPLILGGRGGAPSHLRTEATSIYAAPARLIVERPGGCPRLCDFLRRRLRSERP